MNRLIFLASLMVAPLALAQGMLIPTDTSLGPLGIKYQRVSAEIVDGAAVTKVEQVFVNTSPRQLEAHYVFPLPKGAALQDFYLWINGKRTKGEMLEKQKATDIYEGIVRRLQDPGLLEYVDTDAFRARVFPVPANGEQKIELTFSQVLDFNAGLYQYHYPLGAGTRGAPKLTVRQDFTFSATIKSKTPLRSIYSPTHKLGVSRKGENQATTGLELGAGADISKDLDLFYTVSDKAIGLTFMSNRPDNEQPGFFMALISPRTDVKADEVIAKRVTFVIDTSGSMMGDRMKLARDSLKYCVQKLNPRDEFNVVRFSTDVESLFEKPAAATEANVKKAVEFVSGLEAIGGTAIDEAMVRALKDGANRGERPHMVMFITDGHPTVGETDEATISKDAKDANKGSRVFTFGVGDELNARLLDRMAEEGNGTSDFARDGRDFELKIGAFYDKVANPVLADLALDLSAFGAYDVYPKRLGDLFKGSQLVVMGRYRTPKDGTVLLTGSFNGKKQVFEYRAEAAKESKQFDFVPRLWAIRKVGYLLDTSTSGQSQNDNSSQSLYFSGYTIDDHGNIRIPVLGELNVLGYTIDEIRETVEKKLLEDYFKTEARLFVTVKLAGLRYTINGEIGSTGTKVLYQDKATIMEAIANSGDITITGDRKQVQLIRKYPHGYETYTIDLTKASAMESPYFYIQPNDYIYIKPLRQKSWGTGQQECKLLVLL